MILWKYLAFFATALFFLVPTAFFYNFFFSFSFFKSRQNESFEKRVLYHSNFFFSEKMIIIFSIIYFS